MTGFPHEDLTMALRNLTAQGRRSICSDPAVKDFFLSEDSEERRLATRLCRLRPVQRDASQQP